MRGRAYSTCEGGHDSGTATPGTGLVDSSKIGAALNLNGDVDVGEINLSDMNPEDIRVSSDVEFCTQLQTDIFSVKIPNINVYSFGYDLALSFFGILGETLFVLPPRMLSVS